MNGSVLNVKLETVVDQRFAYIVSDTEVAEGSTLGAPRCCTVVKATGAIEKI